jgi:predicted GNAT superfamily acetyltransferase
MSTVPPTLDATTRQAARAAAAAADRARVTVTALSDVFGARLAARLFAGIWGTGPREPISAEALRALAHAGNYVSGAWVGDELVGASMAFFGRDHESWIMHSHISGVAPSAQRAGTGFALKQHQRAWALERGISEITWTFDPLVRRNAWFNLVKLGAVAVSYHSDFYGPMEDGINAGNPSDRCLVRWHLQSAKAVAASVGPWTDPGEADGLGQGSAVLLEADPGGNPVMIESYLTGCAGPLLCRVPPDIEALRDTDPARAGAWRQALHDAMGAALADGFVAGAISRDGWYVLTRDHQEDTTG